MDKNYEVDFDLLIHSSIQIGNMLRGNMVEKSIVEMHLAEGLGKKIINHVISARHLIQGYQLKLQNKIYEPKIDIASIAILTRAAMETYLTFNHVFVAEEDDKKRELRFLSWDLAGYLERASFVAKLEEHVILKEKEIERAQNRIKQIKSLDAFNNLNSKRQKHIIDGNWRAGFTWFDLAVEAGFNPDFFSQQYKYLCSHAHSGRLSVIQVQQNETIEKQKEMIYSSMGVLMMILAKNMIDYIKIFPILESVKKDMNIYPIVFAWKEIAENFNLNEEE